MAFYQSCLGGALTLTKLSDPPMGDQAPEALRGKIAYAHLKNASMELSATDWMHPTRTPRQGNSVGIYLTGAAYAELKRIFDNLAAGADADLLDELRDMPFGTYGHPADRFGVHWFFRGERVG